MPANATRAAMVMAIALTMGAMAISGCTAPDNAAPAPVAATTVPTVNLSSAIIVSGNVSHPVVLSVSDLMECPQKSISINYSAHHTAGHMNASGVSLNDLLDRAGPDEGAQYVVFKGSDNYTATVKLSVIRADPDALIAIGGEPNGSLRDIIPSQYYATDWVYDLKKVEVQ